MISFSAKALKALLNDIMGYFIFDSFNNCNENVEIAIKTLKDFRAGKPNSFSNVCTTLTNYCIYKEKSRNTTRPLFFPLSLCLSNSRAGLCSQETTSHFPSFHVWNFSCTRHASSTLYILSWIYGWRLGYKFSAWCHWSGTCSAMDRPGAKITVQSHENGFSCNT